MLFHLKRLHIHVGLIRHKFRHQIRQSSTFDSSLTLLRLSRSFSVNDLRDAYFTQAKLCHPDLNKTKSQEELSGRFIQITDAYELLQKHQKGDETSSIEQEIDLTNIVTFTEEQNYRAACRDSLGLDAETVEESKKCPLFREWLKGKTDAAFTWTSFLMVNGGLAPMLAKKRNLSLDAGKNDGRLRRLRRTN